MNDELRRQRREAIAAPARRSVTDSVDADAVRHVMEGIRDERLFDELADAAQIGELVGRTLTPQAAEQWWRAPDTYGLDGRTPREALAAGDVRAVLRAAWALADPGAV